VLTGNLDDGTAGLWAIKDRGGISIVQSPQEAQYPSMPRNAIQQVKVDHVVELHDLGRMLQSLVTEAVETDAHPEAHGPLAIENRIASGDNALEAGILSLGAPSMNTCPHCHGVLTEMRDAGPLRFRCHTGHVFTPANLLLDLDRTIDHGLWDLLRSIDERQMLLEQLIESAKVGGNEEEAQEYARQAEDAKLRGDEIRALVLNPPANA